MPDKTSEKAPKISSSKQVFRIIGKMLKRLITLAKDTDRANTIKDIKEGMILQGSNLWILVCSTFIACIGLDINSPAVIIGAMLISPLMNPILGIGLSAGINDRESLIISSRNFSLAIILSLITAVFYFSITPFGTFTTEMRARVAPTILDAFVAFFGGLAGIIAGSRTNKTNAIPGVAIATALMPPLCTAGFGLATNRWEVFGGAFYLFFINAVLISLSTYLIVKFLKFPLKEHVDIAVAKKTKRFVYAFVLLLLVPSIYFLLNTIHDGRRNSIINEFISMTIHKDIDKGVQWNYESESDSIHGLTVYYFGRYIGPDSVIRLENSLMKKLEENFMLKYSLPEKLVINLVPTDSPPDEEQKRMSDEITLLKSRMVEMQQLQQGDLVKRSYEVDSLKIRLNIALGDTIHFEEIKREVKAFYPELDYFTLARSRSTNFEGTDQMVFIAIISGNNKIKDAWQKRDMQQRIASYLKTKLRSEGVNVLYN